MIFIMCDLYNKQVLLNGCQFFMFFFCFSIIITAGHIERRYMEVPLGATWAEATIRTSGFDTTRRFYIDTLQVGHV